MTREQVERVAEAARQFLLAHDNANPERVCASLNEETTLAQMHIACLNAYRPGLEVDRV